MGNCGSSLDCTKCYNATGANGCATEINVDPDIAGLGVLGAFFVSAVIPCIAILWGYATDSLPLSALTDLDISAIARFQQSGLATAFFPWLGRCWAFFKSSVLKIFAPRRENSCAHTLSRERRQAAIVRLALAFSDQQLVTGLAIMVAALTNRCHLTLYELRIVECLAWFSATTHLATLPILCEYMLAHPIVRNWRVISASVFLFLLGFIQMVNAVASRFNHGTIVQCVFLEQLPHVNKGEIFMKVMVYLLLAWKYARIMLTFYVKFSVRNSYRPAIWSKSRPPKLKLYRWSQYTPSFLSQIALIAFTIAHGISKTVTTIWIHSPKISGPIRRMGFGQVVAIALISLPLLTAAEIYNETKGGNKISPPVNGPTPSITNNPILDGSERTQPRVTSSLVTLEPSSSSKIQQTNDVPSLPIMSPDLNHKPLKLARWTICVFCLDLVLMIFAGIMCPTWSSFLVLLASIILVLRFCMYNMIRFADRIIVLFILFIKKLFLPRREREGVKRISTVNTVAVIRDDDATQVSGKVTPRASISSGRSNNAGPSRSASSDSLRTLYPPWRQDTEATVGMVPAVSSD